MFNFDADFICNPYPTYTYLRTLGPVHWAGDFFGGAWLLTNYADITEALRDTRLSASRSHTLVEQLPAASHAEFAEFNRIFSNWMIVLDPPEHTRLRKALSKSLMFETLDTMRGRIQKIVNELVAGLSHRDEIEFMHEFAHPLPTLVISELMGIDTALRHELIVWSDAISAFFGEPQPTLDMARQAQDALITLTEYFHALIFEKRHHPRQDLVSLLLRTEDEAGPLTADELAAQYSMLLVAGHETTRNLLGNGMLALLKNPDQMNMLRDNAELMPSAIRELLRYDAPVQFTGRVATEDLQIRNQQVRRGQIVVSLLGSANRDPLKFPDPDKLDITRKGTTHLAFGHGPHTCLGAALANLEGELAFKTLLRRFKSIKLLDQEPVWMPNPCFRGLAALPLAISVKPELFNSEGMAHY